MSLLLVRSLPFASDEAIVSFGGVVRDEIAELEARDPAACYDYFYAAENEAIDVNSYESAELLARGVGGDGTGGHDGGRTSHAARTRREAGRALCEALRRHQP